MEAEIQEGGHEEIGLLELREYVGIPAVILKPQLHYGRIHLDEDPDKDVIYIGDTSLEIGYLIKIFHEDPKTYLISGDGDG